VESGGGLETFKSQQETNKLQVCLQPTTSAPTLAEERSSESATEFLRHLYANGIHSTTHFEESSDAYTRGDDPANPIAHINAYEVFQRRLSTAKFKEQRIPESAIRKLVKLEMDDYVQKTFYRALALASTTPAHSLPPNELEVHTGTLCDSCGASPIIGARFMCLRCQNLDLCEQCEYRSQIKDSKVHCKDHPMIKLKVSQKLSVDYSDQNKVQVQFYDNKTNSLSTDEELKQDD
jgi:hypothetical protein